jgi:hypothetical protein
MIEPERFKEYFASAMAEPTVKQLVIHCNLHGEELVEGGIRDTEGGVQMKCPADGCPTVIVVAIQEVTT